MRSGSGPDVKEINGTLGPSIVRLSMPQVGEPEAREFLGEQAVFPALRPPRTAPVTAA